MDAARRAAEIAERDHIVLTRQLQSIDRRIAEAQAPAQKSWRDIFRQDESKSPDLEGLLQERTRLVHKQRAGEGAMLNSRAAVARLERSHQADIATEGQRQRQAIIEAKSQLANIQQARRIVILFPRLAYCRPSYVRSIGARVRRAKLKFGNPNATNIWGLPISGPGTGGRD